MAPRTRYDIATEDFHVGIANKTTAITMWPHYKHITNNATHEITLNVMSLSSMN